MKPHDILLSISTVMVLYLGLVAFQASRTDGHALPSTVNIQQDTGEESPGGFSTCVDGHGNITLPARFRQSWMHIGSWAVAQKKGAPIHEMHDVYTQPATVEAFNKTGKFPDGAVVVKEVRETQTDRLTTGHSAWSTDVKLWFVMVKDRKHRFPDSEHWGDGWGWALFEAEDPSANVSSGYESSCIPCHTPTAENDWIYVDGYPELNKDKNSNS